MKATHIGFILCSVSIILFLAALRPWLPFYASPEEMPVGNYEIAFVTVHVTSHGQPVSHAKVTLYSFWTPQGTDPANLGSPVFGHEAFTNIEGEATLTSGLGNYTVRAEYNNQWAAKNVEVKHTYHDVEIDLSNAQQTLGLSFGYTTVIILCVASVLMAAGVTSFIQFRKKR